MSTDLAKLMIVVTTKGAKETSTQLEDLEKKSRGLASQTNKNVTATKKFTTAQTSFRNGLPSIASGVYLAQQAFSVLSGEVQHVTELYERQMHAEVELQQVLMSTDNAIGLSIDQIYNLADAWKAQTGVNDAVILNAAAIGATFTQVARDVFPDMIEQAMNMSEIFGTDLQQAMIQLGK